jgi:hypothetical protein
MKAMVEEYRKEKMAVRDVRGNMRGGSSCLDNGAECEDFFFHYYIFLIFNFYYCVGLGYIVAFTKVFTIY